ncbi:hypothetical protein ID866_1747 [Astraeus odoratus]|nr:hypothetical protein ID866_1747 [Astraeus odoratus]
MHLIGLALRIHASSCKVFPLTHSKPKERRTRIGGHQPSVKLAKRQFAVPEAAVKAVEIGAAAAASGQEILDSLAAAPPTTSKKERQQRKHEAFIDRVRTTASPYSKAQRRRFNKKTREQVGKGMADMEAVISSLEEKESRSDPANGSDERQPASKPPAKMKQIGKGKGIPLTSGQRKRALEVERLRHPHILSDPRFSGNPFETIRIHAKNTLEKHLPSS